MLTRPSRPLLVAAALLAAAWAFVAFLPPFQVWLYGDVRFYETWGSWIAGHLVPYRDFRIEYPPGSLPVFVLPTYVRKTFSYHGTYYDWFRVEILAIAALTLVATSRALEHLGATSRRMYVALAFSALGVALLGPIALSRYDYWPALFAVAGVAALLGDRPVLACVAFAAGALAKVYPIVLLPLALIELWRLGRTRAVARGLGWAAGVIAAGVVPFLVLAPHGLTWALHRQVTRPLQVESLGAAVFFAAHQLGNLHLHVVKSAGSDNLVGPGPHAAATASGLATIVALLAVYAIYLRGARDKERLATACVAAVVAYVAFSKVFSPQYLIWLTPLVPVVGGRRGLRACVLLGVAVAMTQVWEPYRYYAYWHTFAPWLSWLVVARDLVVVALFLVLLWPERAGGTIAETVPPVRAP